MQAAPELQPVRVLAEDLILVDWGPMTMTISVWDKGRARPVMAVQAAWIALTSLRVLADFQGFLRVKSRDLPTGRALPRVVQRASEAVRLVSDELSPLAAVAGASADEAADEAAALGADKVIVNNGGDIALRLHPGTESSVGIMPPDSKKLMARLRIQGSHGIGGVASSGWAGRSLSTGVADIVTVWAPTASLADAAATFIAGRTTTSSPGIQRTKASDLDHSSDLGDTLVTSHVEPLSGPQRFHAIRQGGETARALWSRGLIRGCLICVQRDTFVLDPDGIVDRGQG